jgi:hypothetical protein
MPPPLSGRVPDDCSRACTSFGRVATPTRNATRGSHHAGLLSVVAVGCMSISHAEADGGGVWERRCASRGALGARNSLSSSSLSLSFPAPSCMHSPCVDFSAIGMGTAAEGCMVSSRHVRWRPMMVSTGEAMPLRAKSPRTTGQGRWDWVRRHEKAWRVRRYWTPESRSSLPRDTCGEGIRDVRRNEVST